MFKSMKHFENENLDWFALSYIFSHRINFLLSLDLNFRVVEKLEESGNQWARKIDWKSG